MLSLIESFQSHNIIENLMKEQIPFEKICFNNKYQIYISKVSFRISF